MYAACKGIRYIIEQPNGSALDVRPAFRKFCEWSEAGLVKVICFVAFPGCKFSPGVVYQPVAWSLLLFQRNSKTLITDVVCVTFPLGFDTLQGTDAAKYIYSFTAEHCTDLRIRKVGWIIENLGSALMWVHPDIAALQQLNEAKSLAFHTCMYGAARRKKTAIWTNVTLRIRY